MTPKTRYITAALCMALALVPAAWGNHQFGDGDSGSRSQHAEFWNYDPSGARTANTSPGLGPDELGKLYSTAGDVVGTGRAPDAFERAVAGGYRDHTVVSPYADAFERAARQGSPAPALSDSHNRMTPTSTSVAPVSSGRDLEWPQIGIGFGAGILLALLLGSALRLVRIRPLAH